MPYPTELDDLPVDFKNETDAITGVDDPGFKEPGEGEHAKRHNEPADAVNRIQAELGLEPAGEHDDVAERLASLDLVLGSKASGTALAAEVKAREEADAAKASKAEVTAAITKLIGGAPEALDTLKEVYETLKSAEESDDAALAALSALVEGKLAKAANLADLANAASARANLGLGSAATQASSAFDAAGAAAAAVAVEVTAREAAVQARIEEVAREGAPEKFWPALAGFKLFKTQALVITANSGHLLRWVPPRNMTLRGVSFITTVVSTANDECGVVLKDTDGKTTLAKSLATAGLLNSTVSRKDVDFTGDVAVTAGHVYYLGFQYGTVGGTAATLLSAEVNNGNSVGGVWGTAAGIAYLGSATPTFPWATETAFSTAANRAYLIARER